MNVLITIPTFNRPEILKNKTLAFLKSVKTKFKIIVVVDDEEALKEYQKFNPGYEIISCNLKGLVNKKKFIINKYSKKYKYHLNMDDDIDAILLAKNKNWREALPVTNFDETVINCFKKTEELGAHLWGICPYKNAFFSSQTVSTDLKYICGIFHGMIFDGIEDQIEYQLTSHGEDYEKTILYFLQDNKVIRFNYLLTLTKYYRVEGGITGYYGGNDKRELASQEAMNYLANNYPEMCKVIIKKGKTDLKLNRLFNQN